MLQFFDALCPDEVEQDCRDEDDDVVYVVEVEGLIFFNQLGWHLLN